MKDLSNITVAESVFHDAYVAGGEAAKQKQYQFLLVAPGDSKPSHASCIAEWKAMVDTGVVSTYGSPEGEDLEDHRLVWGNGWAMGFQNGYMYATSLRSKLSPMKRGDTIRSMGGVYSIKRDGDTYTVFRTFEGIPVTMLESALQSDIASWVNIRGLSYGWE